LAISGIAVMNTNSKTPMPPGAFDRRPAEKEARKMPRTMKKPGLPASGSAK
jgi:hypothetical protein